MKVKVVKAHERPVTATKYFPEGDLLVSGAKDKKVQVWKPSEDKLMYSYDATGAVNAVAIYKDYVLIASMAGVLHVAQRENILLRHQFSKGGLKVLELNQKKDKLAMLEREYRPENILGAIQIFKTESLLDANPVPESIFQQPVDPWTSIIFNHTDEHLYGFNSKGMICKVSEAGSILLSKKVHAKEVTSLRYSRDFEFLVSASKDGTAKLLNPDTLETLREVNAQRPLNCAMISPLMYHPEAAKQRFHVIVGGGQEAREVTTTKAAEGQFQVSVFDLVHCEEVCAMRGHIGPVYSVDFTPDGMNFVSGSEDGTIRITMINNEYFQHTDN